MLRDDTALFDPYEIRRDFPLIHELGEKEGFVYLDNAATTHKPIQVVEAVSNYYLRHYSNIHRGSYRLSVASTELYEEAHEAIARHINADSWQEIVFSFNTTTSVNMIAIPLLRKALGEGKDKIVLTVMEHHSNMLPWREAAGLLGARIDYLGVDKHGVLDLREAEEKIDERTGIVAITHVSNATGVLQPAREVFRMAGRYGAYRVLDGAQSMPHMPINVKQLETDFYTFSGHKMMAPTGTGGFYGRLDILEELSPHIVGGGIVKNVGLDKVLFADPPYRFEAGTPNIAGAIGLLEAVKYIERLGKENIYKHEKDLAQRTRRRLEEIGGIDLYPGKMVADASGIVAFNVKGMDPASIGEKLDREYNISVRAGRHCAHPYHEALGLKRGTVRASYYLYNTVEEADKLVEAVSVIAGDSDRKG